MKKPTPGTERTQRTEPANEAERVRPEALVSGLLGQLAELRRAHPDAATVPVPRDDVDALLFAGAILAVRADTLSRELEKLREEDRQAFAGLFAGGSKRERLERFGKVKGALTEAGTLFGDRGGKSRTAVVCRYLWLLRVEHRTRAEAADVIAEEFGYPSRKAVRSALERWEIEISADPTAPEWRQPAIVLDDSGESKPWPRRPVIPIPPEEKSLPRKSRK